MLDDEKNESASVNSGDTDRTKKNKKKKEEKEAERELKVLRQAARQVALMLCEASAERDFFIIDGTPTKRRLDTKALKEFASVLKEVCSVVAELNGESLPTGEGIRIEFSPEALGYSS